MDNLPYKTIFQLYRGGQFYWLKKPEYPDKTTDLSQVNTKPVHLKSGLIRGVAFGENGFIRCQLWDLVRMAL